MFGERNRNIKRENGSVRKPKGKKYDKKGKGRVKTQQHTRICDFQKFTT